MTVQDNNWAANTAIGSKSPSPGVRWLHKQGYLHQGMECLDFGAGRGRNADWLRGLGLKVFAYDPYHSNSSNPYTGVANILPNRFRFFDFAFTSYVLNVLPKEEEEKVIAKLELYAPGATAHIVRGDRELTASIKQMFNRGNKYVVAAREAFNGTWEAFCRSGVCTGKNRYQRISIPNLPLICSTKAWKIYVSL